MTRSEIEKDMKKFAGGACWMNRSDLARYLGFDRKSSHVTDIIHGLVRIGGKYAIVDLSERVFAEARS